jgi:hypothetical protein
MIFHFSKSEAIIGVPVTFGHDTLDRTVLLKQFAELVFNIPRISLNFTADTSPSRLVINSLVTLAASSEGDRGLLAGELDFELLSEDMTIINSNH